MTGPALGTRISIIHGVLQRLADQAGADVLHIKGPAVAEELLDTRLAPDPDTGEPVTVTIPRPSSDADVLVRPEHVERFLAEVTRHGWIRKTTFTTSSAFGHALNIYHPRLGNADVHRHFPGLGDDAFAQIWNHRQTKTIAHVGCTVPSLRAQRLLLLLHAARSGPTHPDTERAWGRANDEERDDVLTLAKLLGAEVGVAAAIGTLDEYRSHPQYLLWKHFREANPSRLHEWHARWRAATTVPAKARVVRSFIVFDPASLESDLGHTPTKREILRRNVARFGTMVRELNRLIRRKGRP